MVVLDSMGFNIGKSRCFTMEQRDLVEMRREEDVCSIEPRQTMRTSYKYSDPFNRDPFNRNAFPSTFFLPRE
jgi:hypothetical protein